MLRKVLLGLLSIFMLVAGLGHFINPAFYLRMMPPFIPLPELMIQLSGLIEMLLGILLLIPRTRIWGAWGLIALLVAVYPANLYMFLHRDQWPEIPELVQFIRLPFQLVFIAWAWMFTRPAKS